jgi:hypothetical protein
MHSGKLVVTEQPEFMTLKEVWIGSPVTAAATLLNIHFVFTCALHSPRKFRDIYGIVTACPLKIGRFSLRTISKQCFFCGLLPPFILGKLIFESILSESILLNHFYLQKFPLCLTFPVYLHRSLQSSFLRLSFSFSGVN